MPKLRKTYTKWQHFTRRFERGDVLYWNRAHYKYICGRVYLFIPEKEDRVWYRNNYKDWYSKVRYEIIEGCWVNMDWSLREFYDTLREKRNTERYFITHNVWLEHRVMQELKKGDLL